MIVGIIMELVQEMSNYLIWDDENAAWGGHLYLCLQWLIQTVQTVGYSCNKMTEEGLAVQGSGWLAQFGSQ